MASPRRQVNRNANRAHDSDPVGQISPTDTGAEHLAIRPREAKEVGLSTKKEANPLWRRLPPDDPALYHARLWQGLLDIATLELFSPTHLELPHKVPMRKFPRGFVTPGGGAECAALPARACHSS